MVGNQELLCPQNVKLTRITWVDNIGGQIYAAAAVKGVGENVCPLRQWQGHVGVLQQYISAFGWAIGRHNCQRRPANGDAGNSGRGDVTNLKKVDLRAGTRSGGKGVQDQSLPAGTVRDKSADNVLSWSGSVGSKT